MNDSAGENLTRNLIDLLLVTNTVLELNRRSVIQAPGNVTECRCSSGDVVPFEMIDAGRTDVVSASLGCKNLDLKAKYYYNRGSIRGSVGS
jgi:hypothetical protein